MTTVEERNADTIRTYWQARGYAVRVQLVLHPSSNRSEARFVRSDLVNGLPRGWSKEAEVAAGRGEAAGGVFSAATASASA